MSRVVGFRCHSFGRHLASRASSSLKLGLPRRLCAKHMSFWRGTSRREYATGGSQVPRSDTRPLEGIRWSADTSPGALQPDLHRVLHTWQLGPNCDALVRNFSFPTFKTAWAFMNEVAEHAARQRHHPEWSNSYNKVSICWTTHKPAGLSDKDVKMAELCDQIEVRMRADSVPYDEAPGDQRAR